MLFARISKTVGIAAVVVALMGVVGWLWVFSLFPLVLATATGVTLIALGIGRFLTKRVPKGTVLELDLDSGVVEHRGTDPVGQLMTRGAVTVRDIVDTLGRAADDPRITGLVVRLGNGGIQMAHAQEIRDAVHVFRGGGKKTVAFSESFGEGRSGTVDYYVAAAFEEIVLQPSATTSVQGLVGHGRFVRGLFDKLGVIPDMDHRMEYKAAKNMLTETEFTEPHRESVETIVGEQFTQVVSGIATDRGMSESAVEAAFDQAPLMAMESLAVGLVDHLGFRDEAYGIAGGDKLMFIKTYLKKAGRPHRKGKQIGLIYGTGAIYRGGSSFDLLSQGSSLGADDVATAFRQAMKNKKLTAIVFRVDSPGGSAVASDVVRREVIRAKDAGKPVVVSMSNVAGSGGYWISAEASRIVAQPGTITGSIGVVSGKLATRQTWANAGITFDEVSYGQNATFFSSRDVFTDTERERHVSTLDTIYDDFTSLVTEARGLDQSRVGEIAKGRVWTGTQAQANGLVDELGGLETAIGAAKALADIPRDESVSIVEYPKKQRRLPPIKRDSSEPVYQLVDSLTTAIGSLQPRGVHLRLPDINIG